MVPPINKTIYLTILLYLYIVGCGGACSIQNQDYESEEVTAAEVEQSGRSDTVFVRNAGYMTTSELFDRFMANRLKESEVFWYAEKIADIEHPGVEDSLLHYAARYPKRSDHVLSVVAQIGSPKLSPWLETHAENLDRRDWSNLGAALEHGTWRDSTVSAIMLNHVLTASTTDLSAVTAVAFTGMGTLDEIRILAQVADTTQDPMLRQVATSTLARFDVPELNDEVRDLLPTLETTWTNVVYALRRHNRYDFLPEIRRWAKQFDPGSHGRQELEALIADLEQKKAEGAPLGVPLNYPASTRADSSLSE